MPRKENMIKLRGVEIKPTIFPDGTSQVWHLPPDLLRPSVDPVEVYWKFENEAEIIQLAQLKLLLAAHSIIAYLEIRTLPYARQDKPVGNETTFALTVFAEILNQMKWAWVVLNDPHSNAAQYHIAGARVRYYDYEARQVVRMLDSDVVCFPDEGSKQKYKLFDYSSLTLKLKPIDYVSATKKRNQATGEVTFGDITGDVKDKKVMIVDDICDGGATFVLVAKALREAGAKDVFLFVSHGIFSKGLKPLLDGGISRIFTPEGEATL